MKGIKHEQYRRGKTEGVVVVVVLVVDDDDDDKVYCPIQIKSIITYTYRLKSCQP